MTREEAMAKMAELRAKAEEKVSAYNDAIQNGNFNEGFKLDAEITEIINEYTSIARGIVFEECLATDDPMREAVKRLTYMTIAVRDEKHGDDGETKIPVRVIIDKERDIDLLKLHKKAKDGIGYDKKWNYLLEKLNFLMTAQKAVDLGIDPKGISDTYEMSDIAKEINMGKTPCSKTNILKTLQTCITAMLGEDAKATSHDVAFLMSVYSRKNRAALTVTCANHRYMRKYVAEICHRIVTDGTYKIDYKVKKS